MNDDETMADQVWCKWCKRMVVVGETHSSHIEIVTDPKMKPGQSNVSKISNLWIGE